MALLDIATAKTILDLAKQKALEALNVSETEIFYKEEEIKGKLFKATTYKCSAIKISDIADFLKEKFIDETYNENKLKYFIKDNIFKSILGTVSSTEVGIPIELKSTTVQDAHAAPKEIWLQCSRAAAQGLASEPLSYYIRFQKSFYSKKKNLMLEILLLHIHGITGCILDAENIVLRRG